MPSVSKKQRRFMAAELNRARAGNKTLTGMTEEQLSHYASTPDNQLPERVPKPMKTVKKIRRYQFRHKSRIN
jgi:hypothetical protein